MKGISMKSVVLAGALLTFASSAASANTLTPGFISYVPGASISYDASLVAAKLVSGDGFTIFDIGGFVLATTTAPAGWTVSFGALTQDFGAPVFGPDDAALMNVHFTYGGSTITAGASMSLGTFTIGTTWAGPLTSDDWVSQDHPNPPGTAIGTSASTTAVPTIPDGGSTMALLGLAMLSMGLLRRHLL